MRVRLLRAFVAGVFVVVAAGCGSSSAPSPTVTPSTPTPTPQPTGNGTPVSIAVGATALADKAYAPNPIVIATGGSVTWTNSDTVTHTSTADAGQWDSGRLAPGASFTHTFPTAGSYAYHCTLHPGMMGTVTVQ